jgi:Outer membrane lipoprotein carrier protein LolA-like
MRRESERRLPWLGLYAAAVLGAHPVVLASELPPAAPSAASDRTEGLSALLTLLARRERGEADFSEEQELALLKAPLQSSGVLIYQAPDHLEQRTVLPHPQTAVLDHGVLTVQVGHHRRTLRLSDAPQVAPLLDAVRAVLAGDRGALERLFTLRFSGTLERWQLQLEPRDAVLATTLEHIVLTGEGDQVRQVEVIQKSGEHLLMHITARP